MRDRCGVAYGKGRPGAGWGREKVVLTGCAAWPKCTDGATSTADAVRTATYKAMQGSKRQRRPQQEFCARQAAGLASKSKRCFHCCQCTNALRRRATCSMCEHAHAESMHQHESCDRRAALIGQKAKALAWGTKQTAQDHSYASVCIGTRAIERG